MTGEAQRIAMAKLLGWHQIENSGPLNFPWSGYPPTVYIIGRKRQLPDYLGERNLTFDAAEQLGEATIKAMRFWLFEICGEMKAHHATAAQETEAILRHHGKWVEEKTELTTA